MNKNQIKNKNKGIGAFFRSLLQSLNIHKKSVSTLPQDIPAPIVIHENTFSSPQEQASQVIKLQKTQPSHELSPAQHFQLGVDCFQHIANDDGDIHAFRHFQKAAELGHAEAQAYLAYMYQMGYATPKDPQKAFQWGLAAAQNNIAEAQFSVALCYLNGSGTTFDLDQAIHWLQSAAEKNIPDAQCYLGHIHSGQNVLRQDMHRHFQPFFDINLAENYYLSAARSNDLESQLQLAKIYLSNQYGKKNISIAKQLLQTCAQAGLEEALYLLGMQYLTPEHGEPDYQQASSLLYQAAQNKNADAMYELGCLYEHGKGVEKNKDLSKRYLKLAAAAKHIKAKQKLYEDFNIFADERPRHQKERTSVIVKLI